MDKEEWENKKSDSKGRFNLTSERNVRLAKSLGVFLSSSIILFIIFGDTWSFAAGYVHAVLFNHRKKTKKALWEIENKL